MQPCRPTSIGRVRFGHREDHPRFRYWSIVYRRIIIIMFSIRVLFFSTNTTFLKTFVRLIKKNILTHISNNPNTFYASSVNEFLHSSRIFATRTKAAAASTCKCPIQCVQPSFTRFFIVI